MVVATPLFLWILAQVLFMATPQQQVSDQGSLAPLLSLKLV